jgi:methyltransferase (TIGR00027 family)
MAVSRAAGGAAGTRIATSHSDTAEATAAMRAAESRQAERRRLVDDPIARYLVRRLPYRLPLRSAALARLVLGALDRRCPGLHGHIVLRSRYADDVVRAALDAGAGQVVLLGAGFDTTAYRLPGPATVFEVDVPTTQATKRQRLARVPHEPVTEPVYVPCDFATDRLADRLVEAGIDRSVPTVFTWMGVVTYLTMEAFHSTVADVAACAAAGSRLVVDYVEAPVVDGTTTNRGGRRMAQMVARRGEPLRTGFTPDTLRAALAEHGAVVDDDADLAELAARYPAPDGVWCSTDGFNRIASAEFRPRK